ncbi:MAG: hypothetical protein SF029_26040 [bacterium]|nr:hypothetical protein [bacterium]
MMTVLAQIPSEGLIQQLLSTPTVQLELLAILAFVLVLYIFVRNIGRITAPLIEALNNINTRTDNLSNRIDAAERERREELRRMEDERKKEVDRLVDVIERNTVAVKQGSEVAKANVLAITGVAEALTNLQIEMDTNLKNVSASTINGVKAAMDERFKALGELATIVQDLVGIVQQVADTQQRTSTALDAIPDAKQAALDARELAHQANQKLGAIESTLNKLVEESNHETPVNPPAPGAGSAAAAGILVTVNAGAGSDGGTDSGSAAGSDTAAPAERPAGGDALPRSPESAD